MKSNVRWLVALAVVLAMGPGDVSRAAESEYEKEQRAAAAARAKDPLWKPSCNEAGVIQIGDSKSRGALRNFCLNAEGNILACFAPTGATKSSAAENGPGIRVYSPAGKLLKTTPVEFKPTAISVAKDGSLFVGGDGQVIKLDAAGKVVASAPSPVAKDEIVISSEVEEMVKETVKETKGSFKDELRRMKETMERRRSDVTGLAVTDQDVFISVPSTTDFTYRIYRFDHELKNPKLVVEKLRGCCGQMDIQAHEDKLWIPHNARHAVESRDRDGKELSKFGKAGRIKAADFGGCCEPKNMRVLADGDLLVAESGPPTCIKRFTADGKFKQVVAVVDGAKGDCVRVTVAMSPDGKSYYMLDTTRDAIRVFKPKKIGRAHV